MSKLFKYKRSKDYKQFLKWIEALRSGDYSQTTGSLQDYVGYCCLGVACRELIPVEQQIKGGDGELVGGMPKSQFRAPKWLKDINDDFCDKVEREFDLPGLNDNEDFSFDEIADVLEAVYKHGALDE